MKTKTTTAPAEVATAVTSIDERRLAILKGEIDALLPAFERAVAEEDRLYDAIHALQEEMYAIEHRDAPDNHRVIFPELSGDPITITVRTGYFEKKIRFSVGDYGQMKRAGLYPSVNGIVPIIARELAARGADVTVDKHRSVCILTQESWDARLAAWAERLEAQRAEYVREDDDDE